MRRWALRQARHLSQFLEPVFSSHSGGHGVFPASGGSAISRTASIKDVSASRALRSTYLPADSFDRLGVFTGHSVLYGTGCGAEAAPLRVCTGCSAGLAAGAAVSRVEGQAASHGDRRLV